MGSGEYGGNGSVHWKVQNGKGRQVNPNGKNGCDGIDDEVNSGGYFNVVVEYVEDGDWKYDAATKTLTGRTVIKHDDKKYTKQVSVKWP